MSHRIGWQDGRNLGPCKCMPNRFDCRRNARKEDRPSVSHPAMDVGCTVPSTSCTARPSLAWGGAVGDAAPVETRDGACIIQYRYRRRTEGSGAQLNNQ